MNCIKQCEIQKSNDQTDLNTKKQPLFVAVSQMLKSSHRFI
ncbi:hypothetical protein AS4_19330 [Acinetobacter guillouiae]|nr:hypothetical protein AS4_19330 [Acinetobacter guillouiae]